MTINHVEIVDPDIHQPKGVSLATTGTAMFANTGVSEFRPILIADVADLDLTGTLGDVFTADGAGSGAMLAHTPAPGSASQGTYFYEDATTGVTPIALTLANTQYELTNDAAGAGSISFPVGTLSEIWDPLTNTVVWTEGGTLSVGDSVDFRLDIRVTTTAINTAITVVAVGGVGEAITIPLIPSSNFKDTGTYELVRWMGFFMRDTATLNEPARFLIEADSTGVTVEVIAWYFRATHTNT